MLASALAVAVGATCGAALTVAVALGLVPMAAGAVALGVVPTLAVFAGSAPSEVGVARGSFPPSERSSTIVKITGANTAPTHAKIHHAGRPPCLDAGAGVSIGLAALGNAAFSTPPAPAFTHVPVPPARAARSASSSCFNLSTSSAGGSPLAGAMAASSNASVVASSGGRYSRRSSEVGALGR
ncbi:MAG: hypothetical protein QM820_29695 [Minicystis sp.]